MVRRMRKPKSESQALAEIDAEPLPAVQKKTIEELLNTPQYTTLAAEVFRRSHGQTRFYHVVPWQQTHWWDLQRWINQVQWELEQIFGPVVRLQSTQKQVHGGKVYILGFFEIGPISPDLPPLRAGSLWRQFLASLEE